MQLINLTIAKGMKCWQKIVARANGGADPSVKRQDPLTLHVFGRPVTPCEAVTEILAAIRKTGDRALLRYVEQLDGCKLKRPSALVVNRRSWQAAAAGVEKSVRVALWETAAHIRSFHESQMTSHRGSEVRFGVRVSEVCKPIERVGIYVPGGNAPLIASVLMNAIPAQVAGVSEIVMATPPRKDGTILPAMLLAAEIAGVHEVYCMGGAPAIAALAYGTKTIQRVDKIVGPANIFGTEAKRQLVGQVGIDSLAGPSEILIIADGSAHPEALAWDLLAQGEHGSGSVAILLSSKSVLLRQVEIAIRAIVQEYPGIQQAQKAVVLGLVREVKHAIALSNEYAPEHLSLQINEARQWVGKVKQAGAIFLGKITAQAMGDYTAGPNHVLPTAGTARWSSPLSIRDFVHYTSVVEYTRGGMRKESPTAIAVAEAEGLIAHARSIYQRIKP